MRGTGKSARGAALFPGNSGELLHQAADGLGVSGGVIHGQALDELCLCVEQSAVLLELLGIASLLCGFQHSEDGVVDVQFQDFIALDVLAAGLLESTFSISMERGPSADRQTGWSFRRVETLTSLTLPSRASFMASNRALFSAVASSAAFSSLPRSQGPGRRC